MEGLTINKTRYRVILEVEAYDDLDPLNFNWSKAMKLDTGESVRVLRIEDDDDDYMY